MNKWYAKYSQVYGKPLSDIPAEVIGSVREKLQKLQSDTPLVTVSLIAYNEEKHLTACLWSLSEMRCKYPVEIIGVNNDSSDRTEEIFKLTGVPYYNEPRHSCGYARSCGLSHARGKYHVNIDTDTLYPAQYVQIMVEAMESRAGCVAVSSLWSYMPDKEHSSVGLKLYESTRDAYLFLQSLKRPELSVRGMVFAYRTDLARQVGIRTDIIRGEDGSLAFGLKKYGRIAFVRNRMARPVTGYGTIGADGSLFDSFKVRFLKGMRSLGVMFSKEEKYECHESNLVKK